MNNAQSEVTAIIEKAKANPNDAEAQVAAAIQFIQIERPQEAMPFLEQARKVSPNDSRVSGVFGLAHFIMRDLDQSTEWLKRAREQGADDPVVISFLIGSYIQTGKNLDEAGRLLEELEKKGVDSGKLARIREDLNAARASSSSSVSPAPTPKANTTLSHGPEAPKTVK